jgi:NAD(P)-dependent dehydrogenase (short-subunit alcohol dehydrogenase family)
MSASFKYLHKLNGKRVLIFGGSPGFGFAVAEAAIEFGATIFISGSNPERLDTAVSRLKKQYPHASEDQIGFVAIDLANLDSLDSRLEELFDHVAKGGRQKIDHIVFCFTADAIRNVPSLGETTIEDVNHVLRLRPFSPSILAKVVARRNISLARLTRLSLSPTASTGTGQ